MAEEKAARLWCSKEQGALTLISLQFYRGNDSQKAKSVEQSLVRKPRSGHEAWVHTGSPGLCRKLGSNLEALVMKFTSIQEVQVMKPECVQKALVRKSCSA